MQELANHLAVASVDLGGAGALFSGAPFLHGALQRGVGAGQERAAQAPLGGASSRRAGLVLLIPVHQLLLQLLHRRIWPGGHLASTTDRNSEVQSMERTLEGHGGCSDVSMTDLQEARTMGGRARAFAAKDTSQGIRLPLHLCEVSLSSIDEFLALKLSAGQALLAEGLELALAPLVKAL